MSLNVGYTCGTIDDCIGDTKERIKNHLIDFTDTINPYIDIECTAFKSILVDYIEYIYTDIEHAYEGVRNSNKELRDDAENIIDRLEQEVYNKDIEIQELNDEIYRLTNE